MSASRGSDMAFDQDILAIGCDVARDAAGCGCEVLLAEMNDLAKARGALPISD